MTRRTTASLRSPGTLLCAAVLVSLAGGCAVGPRYREPASAATVRAQYKEAGAVATPAAPSADGRWWQAFHDDALDELERQVEVSNQTLAQAQAAWRQASAVVREQRSALWPTIGLGAGAQRSRSEATANRTQPSYQAQANANWELDLWGRLRRTLETARASERASAADLQAARLSTQGLLATTYFQLRETDVERTLLATTVESYERALQITRNRYEAGVVARGDVLQAQTQLSQAQSTGAQLELQRAQLEHALADLVGRAPADFTLAPVAALAAAAPPAIPEIPAGLPSELLRRRPDVVAAERRVAAANASIGIAESAWFPSITLTGTLGFTSTAFADLFKSPSQSRSAAASAAGTLFDAGARSARVAEAHAGYDASVAKYRQTVLDALRAVEDALAGSRVLARQYELLRAASQAADQAEQIAANRYRAGQISYTDVVVLQAAALAARRELAAAVLARQSSVVSLVTALGGGWGGGPDAGAVNPR
jgi:NodT family efflux transporter outer membrane factor (OMF) lipoprotein